MTNRERFIAVLNGEKPDRLPVVEWASWWDQTVNKWMEQGMPQPEGDDPIQRFYGLDPLRQIWISPRAGSCPQPKGHGAALMTDEADYEALKPHLYPAGSEYGQGLAGGP